jgi:RNA polymerase sigma-B factor
MTRAGSATGWTPAKRAREHHLLTEFAQLRATSSPEMQVVRNELVTMHLPLVHYLAKRYSAPGASAEDLAQVGAVGLINAVDRFDVTLGNELSTFAAPHILGEMRKYFRDATWSVHVPRRLRDLHTSVNRARDDLSVSMGRSPTVAEVAEHLGLASEDVLEALELTMVRSAPSIDTPTSIDGRTVADTAGIDDAALEDVVNRATVKPLLDLLPEREREIVVLRFFGDQSQSQIAEKFGISQVHVSRLLAKSMASMRLGFESEN